MAGASDGYAQFDDVHARLPGPVVAQVIRLIWATLSADTIARGRGGGRAASADDAAPEAAFADSKPYFIGRERRPSGRAAAAFTWEEPSDPPFADHTPAVRLAGAGRVRWCPLCGIRYAGMVAQRQRGTASGIGRSVRRDAHGRAGCRGPHALEFPIRSRATMRAALLPSASRNTANF